MDIKEIIFSNGEYDIEELAEYIVKKCWDEGEPINNLQLQRILYCIQKEFFRKKRCKAFSAVTQARQIGVVFPEVYNKYCAFGTMSIIPVYENTLALKKQHTYTINLIIEEKRKLLPWDWVDEINKPGGAWDKAYKRNKSTFMYEQITDRDIWEEIRSEEYEI